LYLILDFGITIMSAVSIRLPDDVSTRLEDLAKLTGRSKTFYMIEAIREHLDDIEDLYLAEQRLIENRAERSKTYSLEEIEHSLGLAD
jgi:RHH-type transcriptional regulator, rel operon repressor / antitoxin RelB